MVEACFNCGSTETDTGDDGSIVCTSCGRVLEQVSMNIVNEVGFAEGANGTASVVGQFVSAGRASSRLPGNNKESREQTLERGKRIIQGLANQIQISRLTEPANRYFTLAVQHNFIQGRRTNNVCAACLYIVCRMGKTPHMLIDFSELLGVSVYDLGHTFLNFCKMLNIRLPIVDPSLYIQRFASKLEFAEKTTEVAATALKIVARMKRDWILTGRRPSGICGAGLLIAARMHGFKRTMKEIVQVVRICDVTLRKRLMEFGQTPTSHLTPEEFNTIDLEEECDPPAFKRARLEEEKKRKKLEQGSDAEEDEEEEKPKKKKAKKQTKKKKGKKGRKKKGEDEEEEEEEEYEDEEEEEKEEEKEKEEEEEEESEQEEEEEEKPRRRGRPRKAAAKARGKWKGKGKGKDKEKDKAKTKAKDKAKEKVKTKKGKKDKEETENDKLKEDKSKEDKSKEDKSKEETKVAPSPVPNEDELEKEMDEGLAVFDDVNNMTEEQLVKLPPTYKSFASSTAPTTTTTTTTTTTAAHTTAPTIAPTTSTTTPASKTPTTTTSTTPTKISSPVPGQAQTGPQTDSEVNTTTTETTETGNDVNNDTNTNTTNTGPSNEEEDDGNLSDILDAEVDHYLVQNEEIVKEDAARQLRDSFPQALGTKEIIWNELNKDYIIEQERKAREMEELIKQGWQPKPPREKKKREIKKDAESAAAAAAAMLQKKQNATAEDENDNEEEEEALQNNRYNSNVTVGGDDYDYDE